MLHRNTGIAGLKRNGNVTVAPARTFCKPFNNDPVARVEAAAHDPFVARRRTGLDRALLRPDFAR
jgi:hypothetical protein